MSEHPHYTLFVFSIVHFLIFILVVSMGATTVEYKYRYDEKCVTGQSVTVNFNITEAITTPIYFYYELDNFYQNHFRFAGSYSFEQLQGKHVNDPLGCQPIREEKESPDSNKKITLAPCGLISRYMFNDTYTLPGTFSEQGIAWPHQINKSYHLPNKAYSDSARWMKKQASVLPNLYENETINEHYLNWMHIAPRKHFKKLYAVNNNTKIPAGQFTVIINCNYDNSIYKYKRYISILAPGKLGGKNQLIWVLNLVMSVLSGVSALIFVYFNNHAGRKFYYNPVDPLLNDGVETVLNEDENTPNDNTIELENISPQ